MRQLSGCGNECPFHKQTLLLCSPSVAYVLRQKVAFSSHFGLLSCSSFSGMVWGSGGERALKEQGNRENGTNLTMAFLRLFETE